MHSWGPLLGSWLGTTVVLMTGYHRVVLVTGYHCGFDCFPLTYAWIATLFLPLLAARGFRLKLQGRLRDSLPSMTHMLGFTLLPTILLPPDCLCIVFLLYFCLYFPYKDQSVSEYHLRFWIGRLEPASVRFRKWSLCQEYFGLDNWYHTSETSLHRVGWARQSQG